MLRLVYIVSIIAFFYLILPYFWILVLACVTAYLSYPIYSYTKKQIPTNKNRIPLIITWLGLICIIVIPLMVVVTFLWSEIPEIYKDISTDTTLQEILASLQKTLRTLSFNQIDINPETLKDKLLPAAQSILTSLGWVTTTIGSSVLNTATWTVLFIFATSWVIIHGKELLSYIKNILPLDTTILETYLQRLWKMTSGIIYSTCIIAILQGIVTAVSFYIAWVPYTFFFMVLATLLAIIPMIGAAAIALVIGVWLLLSWNIWWGIFVILINQIVVNNIDNVLRPKLIPEDVKINDTLLIISVFSWLSLWWVGWILYGPVVMSFALTTFEITSKYLPGVRHTWE